MKFTVIHVKSPTFAYDENSADSEWVTPDDFLVELDAADGTHPGNDRVIVQAPSGAVRVLYRWALR